MQIFNVIIFFELRTIQQKTVKPFYLCPLGARKLAEGKGHETGSLLPFSFRQLAVSCPFPSASFQAPKGQRSQGTKISWFNCFLLYCTQLEKDDYIENLHVLSCSVLLKSLLLISCVFWVFFQNASSQLCFRFFFFFFFLHHFSNQKVKYILCFCCSCCC